MCGLTGFWGSSADGPVIQSQLQRMTQQIQHRGPDSDGHWVDANAGIALGHRRLAIVDLSPAGAQPMQAVSGRWVMAFNGEIYNHLHLRAELERSSLAPVWRGHSDTETLLAGFDAWGIRATIEKCVGMFAMAVWCRQTHSLTLVRDRLGEKPLYYGWQGQGSQAVFLFGSELKALSAHPAFTAEIDRQALGSYMQNMAVGGTHSIYKGIHKVPPGTILTVSSNKPDPVMERYWSVEQVAAQGVANRFTGSAAQAVDALEALLKDAVAQQMMADVPLGAFLSGGVDSSTIVALMQAQSSRPVKTFSIGFHEKEYNEAEHASVVAGHLGTDHTDLYVTAQQAMDVIPRLPSLYDEPFADSSQIPTFLVSQMTGQHVKVALSGDAGDELFAGYNRYQLTASLWPKLSSMPQPMRKLAAWGLTRFSSNTLDRFASYTPLAKRWSGVGDKLHKGAGVMGAGSIADLYQSMVAMGWSKPSALVRGMDGDAISLNMPDLPGLRDVERMMAFDLLNYLPDDILTKVDRAAMGVSLETRVPFLDHRVVEFAWRLPMDYKMRRENGRSVTKWALRQVLYRHVPQALIERPKVGFGVPIEHWLRGPLRDWAEDLLSEARINRDGFLNPRPVRQRWKEHLSGKRNWQHSIWCVLMFNLWLDEQKRSVSAA
ncbi:asparagine synthase (glutamine-hydrolyzing) [Limnohabitans sp. 63ED37-2]|uniref:asparagine synthase (glutamine-hydrolyzing) n=1 Tax=Limnohabitans sp. 63ED37-2 TaxID=1678128 RepID=UPI000705C7DB|nr:asparagine synthase (glutamine-hydrolyzing) [Limnohabitans sp. 63ED37-2]ALK87354.1 Asparagine synthetase [glutamine-hydrolyzing] 1 [Limnohabitans sp. 63ED37-2]